MNRLLAILCIATSSLIMSCNNSSVTNTPTNTDTTRTTISVVGSYVTADYEKRATGYDWVAILVTQITDSTIQVSARSRADKKKPTCSFDTKANRINDSTYQSTIEGKQVLFQFSADSIKIATAKEADNAFLNFYCSGGASLAGSYHKIKEPIDEQQMDSTVFNQVLMDGKIGFNIRTTGKGSIQHLQLQPFGLSIDNRLIEMDIDGSVVNAEIGDLNRDGFPELLIYTVSAGSGSYGNVMGYSVNNGKSISSISFPAIADNPKANQGYMGHDEFAIVEASLVQRFQTYQTTDNNSKPTGMYRQIQYKLKNGEASRVFVVDKIIEFPAK